MNQIELKALLDSIGPDDAPEATNVDPRWEAMAEDTLDSVELRRMEALAGASGSSRVMGDLFRPLEDDFHARTTARLATLLGQAPAEVEAEPAPRPAPPPAPRVQTPSPVEPGWWQQIVGWLRAGWVMGPVLVAAGALWMLGGPPQSALPAYELEVRGGDRVTRGAEETPAEARLSAGSRLDLVVRPETDVEGPLQAAAFRLEGGAWVDAGLAVHVDPSGAVRASGTVGAEVPATPGPLRLAVVVTRGAGAPDPAWIEGGAPSGAVVLTTSVGIVGR